MWSSTLEKLWSSELTEMMSSSRGEHNIKNKQETVQRQKKNQCNNTTTKQSLPKYPLKNEDFFYFDSFKSTFPTQFILTSRSYVLDLLVTVFGKPEYRCPEPR